MKPELNSTGVNFSLPRWTKSAADPNIPIILIRDLGEMEPGGKRIFCLQESDDLQFQPWREVCQNKVPHTGSIAGTSFH